MTDEYRSISGYVYIEGDVVGDISGQYLDSYEDAPSENTVERTIPVSVLLEGEEISTDGGLTYVDYITYNGGGTRNIPVTGSVWLYIVEGNFNWGIGEGSGTLTDVYGAVTVAERTIKIITSLKKRT